MELKILHTFQTILQTGSFTGAARQLNYTPSTITFHVAQLEAAAGVQIFEKSGRRMLLTKAGEALIPYVEEVLAAAKKLQNFQYDSAEYQGTLSIGAPESLLCFRLPGLLKRFHERAPHVDLRLRSMTSCGVVSALRDGQLDIGFAYRVPDRAEAQLAFSPFEESPAHFYASVAASSRCPDLREGHRVVRELPRISTPLLGGIRRLLDEYLRKKAITFTNTIEIRSTQTIINLVENDMGVALLPDFAVGDRAAQRKLTVIPAEPFSLRSFYGTHKNKWHSPAMKLFVEMIEEYRNHE